MMNRISMILLGLVLCAPSTTAQADEANASQPADFGDKIVVISIERTIGTERYTSSATLKDAKLVKLGDRYFIRGTGYVGKVDEDRADIAWFNGVESSYAWDGVIDFYLFTPEQLEKYRKWIKTQDE